jgi:hypothetical protein
VRNQTGHWLLLHQFLLVGAGERTMSVGTILVILLILVLIGVLPLWPHSRSWGYYPSGGVAVVIVILLILYFISRSPAV